MDKPLVSIVVCCHNRRHYLEQTMKSVFDQTYRPVEIVVLDDGSTDGTDELMRGYGDRVRYHWQENRGIAATRTAACRLARGELIAFQDDDDLMAPQRITSLHDALIAHPSAVFAVGDYALIDPEGNLTGARWMPGNLDEVDKPRLVEDAHAAVLWPKVPGVPHTTLFRAADGERVGWFDEAFKYACSDADFFARLARLGPIVYVKEIVSYYRRGHSAMWNNQLRADYSRLQLFEKHLELAIDDDDSLRKQLQFRLRQMLIQIARLKHQGVQLTESDLEVYVQRGLEMLEWGDRMRYKWHDSVKLPLKKLVGR
ncbi:MAG: glycosyltransferase family 2 protein [Gammaproteobacteria bacterium]